jgi:hypothetical protein
MACMGEAVWSAYRAADTAAATAFGSTAADPPAGEAVAVADADADADAAGFGAPVDAEALGT